MDPPPLFPMRRLIVYLLALGCVFGTLLGVGKALLGAPLLGCLMVLVAVVAGYFVFFILSRESSSADGSS
jgi:hypothetical protein